MATGLQAGLGLGAAMLALSTATAAGAQATVSLSLESDFRVRGVSMSDRRPAADLSVSDDLFNGAYVGAAVLGQDTRGGELKALGHMEYAGYAIRRPDGVTWDFGVNNQDFRVLTATPAHVRYSEAFVGVSDGRFNARLFYTPDYLHQGIQVAYLDLGAVDQLTPNWRFSTHLGMFAPVADFKDTTVHRRRYDARVDLVRRVGRVDLGLAVAVAAPGPAPDPKRSRPGLIATARASF